MYSIFKSLILALCTLSLSWPVSCMELLLLKTIRDQKSGHIELVKALLAKEIDLNFYEPETNITPLRSAICSRQFEIAELLLEAGATTQPPSNQLSPLGAVAAYGYDEFVPLLLKHGAQINIPDATDCSPFAIAAEQGHAECTDLLAKAGGDTTILLPDGHSILSKAATLEHFKVVKVLLKHKADPNIVDGESLTPLKRTVAKGLVAISKLLTMVLIYMKKIHGALLLHIWRHFMAE